jgi:short-subunit dehydrogenase
MKNIQGKTVLLTGASGGIGSAIAHSLAREKVKIIALARSPSQLNILAPEIQALGAEIQTISWDISDITSLKALIDRIDRDVGTIDILINNAGIEIYRAFSDYNTTELQAIFNTNLLSSMELTRLLLPKMLQRKSGHIVNIASLAGKKAPAYNKN